MTSPAGWGFLIGPFTAITTTCRPTGTRRRLTWVLGRSLVGSFWQPFGGPGCVGLRRVGLNPVS